MPMTSMPCGEVKWVGLDVAKDSIAVAVLDGGEVGDPRMDRVAHEEAAIRRLLGRLGPPARLRVCYEAGPTGYELHRLVSSMGVACEVTAPSLVPVARGDRVKTDRRDARRLALLFRAGELTSVRVPTREEEGCRDLCRLRAAAVSERRRSRQRLGSFLLRRSVIYRDGDPWSVLLHGAEIDSGLSAAVILPDDDDDPEDHPWEELASLAEERGVEVLANDLRRVPYVIEFSDQVLERLRPQ